MLITAVMSLAPLRIVRFTYEEDYVATIGPSAMTSVLSCDRVDIENENGYRYGVPTLMRAVAPTRTDMTLKFRSFATAAAVALLTVAGCSGASSGDGSGKIAAVGAESQYASVIRQVGGQYVTVTAIMSNPNTDPHSFEASPRVARTVSEARLIVQNGLGYDDFMSKIESAVSGSGRTVINAQHLLGLPDSTPNPHLWYEPATMPAVAKAVAADLSAIQPGHRAYFQHNLATFDASLGTWRQAIERFAADHPGAPVATTEPVADYLLQAMRANNRTPFSFQEALMNGNDPSPQDVAYQESLLRGREVKAFVYNEQVTDTLTDSLKRLAGQYGIPIVGVYETMPPSGYSYQTWMTAETNAISNAVAYGRSTPTL
jgi:zinc/manganese transport system substrate-binding protein